MHTLAQEARESTARSSTDANAYDYWAAFDFSQSPLEPVPMHRTRVPAAELHFIASHPVTDDTGT